MMRALFAIALAAVGIASCSGPTVQPQVMTQPETICYEDNVFSESATQEQTDDGTTVGATLTNKVVESNTKHCSNKPRVEHVMKDIGVVQECRNYYTSYRIKGRTRHVKGLLCKNGSGDWEAVDQRYSYVN